MKIAVFFLLSSILAYLSRQSFSQPRSHGFFRFFAFESILVMVLLNINFWFADPFSLRQVFSWILLLLSLLLAIHGFYLLRQVGKPRGKIEDTTMLVEAGAYRFIRHPLYSSLLWGAAGVFLKHPSLAGLALLLATTAFLIATARVEEAENVQRFGEPYSAYMSRTKMFLPFLL